jgi:hypothetical protein
MQEAATVVEAKSQMKMPLLLARGIAVAAVVAATIRQEDALVED